MKFLVKDKDNFIGVLEFIKGGYQWKSIERYGFYYNRKFIRVVKAVSFFIINIFKRAPYKFIWKQEITMSLYLQSQKLQTFYKENK